MSFTGTNDLSMGVDGETILATLCSMHDNARASGARTVCLAVPPFALEKVRCLIYIYNYIYIYIYNYNYIYIYIYNYNYIYIYIYNYI